MRDAARIAFAAALALACTGIVLEPRRASAQEISVPALKAAFLANFVKFTEWPEGSRFPGGVFTFCVAGDTGVLQALEANVRRSPAASVATSVRAVTVEGPHQFCQVLYAGGIEIRQVRALTESLRGAAVFTVSDVNGFAEAGGVAQLRLVDGKMRFAINPAAAQRARLALSARLLTLAMLVKDGTHEDR